MAARQVTVDETLPQGADAGLLVGRAWLPGPDGGPTVVLVRDRWLIDISTVAPTMSALLEIEDLPAALRAARGPDLGALDAWLQSTCAHGPDPAQRHLLAPNDLQVVKAAGVTFAESMVERVIEEQARGDAGKADAVRQQVVALVGDDLAAIRPGSPESAALKELLIARNMWSQYLEVGIGPDAEVFTKAAPMSSLGTGVSIGLHPASTWNNPEPEVVLVVNAAGRVAGVALGNDVNLRDFEGRSALLLGKAKDNNGACAVGPFIRLFDERFGIEDVRRAEIALEVLGPEGFVLHGSSSMSKISRDPLDLVRHAMGKYHQYPDGMMLFCGTMFAPIQDRDAPGAGFTHHLGDRVRISSEKLGALVNWVDYSDAIPPWQFGISALFRSLSARGLA
jgi:fumarylacetoacetate (FAA) hydrolase family protein